jgi:hypothetical protein
MILLRRSKTQENLTIGKRRYSKAHFDTYLLVDVFLYGCKA